MEVVLVILKWTEGRKQWSYKYENNKTDSAETEVKVAKWMGELISVERVVYYVKLLF